MSIGRSRQETAGCYIRCIHGNGYLPQNPKQNPELELAILIGSCRLHCVMTYFPHKALHTTSTAVGLVESDLTDDFVAIVPTSVDGVVSKCTDGQNITRVVHTS